MAIKLSVKVPVVFLEDKEEVAKFEVTYRDVSRKDKRKFGKENEEIMELSQKLFSSLRRSQTLEERKDALVAIGSHEKIAEASSKFLTALDKLEKIQDRFAELGGEEKLSEAAELSFDRAIGGKDKEALKVFIEENSDYPDVLESIRADVEKIRGGN